MAITPQVQQVLDNVRQEQSLLKSLEAGQAIQTQLIVDQGKQIAALQAQLAAGGVIGPDDLAALAETNTDQLDVITHLTADIPANTTPAPAPASPAP